MKIKTIQYSNSINHDVLNNKIAIVIDVFRATSVITTALAHGAEKIIVTDSIEEAIKCSNKLQKGKFILGGERKSHKIDGFDYGNSPQSYMNDNIANKTIILTTTNGTKAINFCQSADKILICSLLNAKSIASFLTSQHQDIVIVCAGSQQEFALEDSICAGMILSEIKKFISFEADDFSIALMHLYNQHQNNIESLLALSKSYTKLKANGYMQDIEYCLQQNIYTVTPRYLNGEIII